MPPTAAPSKKTLCTKKRGPCIRICMCVCIVCIMILYCVALYLEGSKEVARGNFLGCEIKMAPRGCIRISQLFSGER